MALCAKQKKPERPPACRAPILPPGTGGEEHTLCLQKQRWAVCAAHGLGQDQEGVPCDPGLTEEIFGEGCSMASTRRDKGVFVSREPTGSSWVRDVVLTLKCVSLAGGAVRGRLWVSPRDFLSQEVQGLRIFIFNTFLSVAPVEAPPGRAPVSSFLSHSELTRCTAGATGRERTWVLPGLSPSPRTAPSLPPCGTANNSQMDRVGCGDLGSNKN